MANNRYYSGFKKNKIKNKKKTIFDQYLSCVLLRLPKIQTFSGYFSGKKNTNPQVLNGRVRIQFVNVESICLRIYTYGVVVDLHAKLIIGLTLGQQETAEAVDILRAYHAHSGILLFVLTSKT